MITAGATFEAVVEAFAECALLGGRAHHVLFALLGADDAASARWVEGLTLMGVALGLWFFGRKRASLLLRTSRKRAADPRARQEAMAVLAIVLLSVPTARVLFLLTEGVQASAMATGLGAIASGAMMWSALGSAGVSRHTAWGAGQIGLVAIATAFSALPGVPMLLAVVVALLWIGQPMRKAMELGALIAGAHAMAQGVEVWVEAEASFGWSAFGILVPTTLASVVGIAWVTRRLDLVFRFAPIYMVGLGGALVLGGFILGSFA